MTRGEPPATAEDGFGYVNQKAKPDTDSRTCDPSCPFLAQWSHPYWHHTAWCWKQMRDLDWHDYWLADCLDNAPSPLAQHRAAGRTEPVKDDLPKQGLKEL